MFPLVSVAEFPHPELGTGASSSSAPVLELPAVAPPIEAPPVDVALVSVLAVEAPPADVALVSVLVVEEVVGLPVTMPPMDVALGELPPSVELAIEVLLLELLPVTVVLGLPVLALVALEPSVVTLLLPPVPVTPLGLPCAVSPADVLGVELDPSPQPGTARSTSNGSDASVVRPTPVHDVRMRPKPEAEVLGEVFVFMTERCAASTAMYDGTRMRVQ